MINDEDVIQTLETYKKVRKILKEYRVDLRKLSLCCNSKEYNTFTQIDCGKEYCLTEEEFKILKEWWENE